jgi:hypothetical protein
MKTLLSIFLLVAASITNAAELICDLSPSTPNEFSVHIPRSSFGILITLKNGTVTEFGPELILKVDKQPLYYYLTFKNGGSAHIDRESLDLTYYNESMAKTGFLGTYYGNSRYAGADYKCRLIKAKI